MEGLAQERRLSVVNWSQFVVREFTKPRHF